MAKDLKPLVFISHIAEEAEVAIALKDLVEPSFLGLIRIFVSSDGESVKLGQKWLDAVSAALKDCSAQIIIASPKSVVRPWVNFEAGSAWVRDVPVIPLCHSGMTPGRLPIPLSLLQAANLGDVAGMKLVINVLAQALGATVPSVDLDSFGKRVKEFEERYTFWDQCNSAFGIIVSISPRILTTLGSHAFLDIRSETNPSLVQSVLSAAVWDRFERGELNSCSMAGRYRRGIFHYDLVPGHTGNFISFFVSPVWLGQHLLPAAPQADWVRWSYKYLLQESIPPDTSA